MKKTKEEIIDDMCDEMPFRLSNNIIPYIKEAINIYTKQETKEANEFIIMIADLLKMDTDGVGFDDISFSIDDFETAIKEYKKQSKKELLTAFAKDWKEEFNNCLEILEEYDEELTGLSDTDKPTNCLRGYVEDLCEGCEFNKFILVDIPDKVCDRIAEKHHCELDYWDDDF